MSDPKKLRIRSFLNPLRVLWSLKDSVASPIRRMRNMVATARQEDEEGTKIRLSALSAAPRIAKAPPKIVDALRHRARVSILFPSAGIAATGIGYHGPVFGLVGGILVIILGIGIFWMANWHYAIAEGHKVSFLGWPLRAPRLLAEVWRGD